MLIGVNNSSLVANIYVGEDGKLHKVQGGADSVLPFKSFDLSLNPTLKNQTNYTATDDCVAFIHGSGGYSPWKIIVTVNNEEVINHTQSNNGYVSFALQLSKDDIINLSFTGFSTLGTGIDIFI